MLSKVSPPSPSLPSYAISHLVLYINHLFSTETIQLVVDCLIFLSSMQCSFWCSQHLVECYMHGRPLTKIEKQKQKKRINVITAVISLVKFLLTFNWSTETTFFVVTFLLRYIQKSTHKNTFSSLMNSYKQNTPMKQVVGSRNRTSSDFQQTLVAFLQTHTAPRPKVANF